MVDAVPDRVVGSVGMLWICNNCTTAYSIGAPSCPHCRSNDHHDQGDPACKYCVAGDPHVAKKVKTPKAIV